MRRRSLVRAFAIRSSESALSKYYMSCFVDLPKSYARSLGLFG